MRLIGSGWRIEWAHVTAFKHANDGINVGVTGKFGLG